MGRSLTCFRFSCASGRGGCDVSVPGRILNRESGPVDFDARRTLARLVSAIASEMLGLVHLAKDHLHGGQNDDGENSHSR